MSRRLAVTCVVALAVSGCEQATAPAVVQDIRIASLLEGTAAPAQVGSITTLTPTVKVTTVNGTPLAGREVVFAVVEGGGTLEHPTVLTNSAGIASAGDWTLGTRTGSHRVIAFVPRTSNGERVVFETTAVPGPAVSVRISPQFSALAVGDSVDLVPTFLDAFNNAAPGPAGFTWTSSGAAASVTPTGRVHALAPGTVQVTVDAGAIESYGTVGVGTPNPTVTFSSLNNADGVSAAFNASGVGYLVSTAQILHRLDGATESLTGSFVSGFFGSDVAFISATNVAWVGETGWGGLKVMDAATNSLLRTVDLPNAPLRVVASPDGAYVYATLFSGGVVRVNTATDQVTTLPVSGELRSIALSPDGSALFVASTNGGLTRIATSSFTITRGTQTGLQPRDIEVSADGRRVLVAREGGAVDMRDASDLSPIATFPALQGAYDITRSSDGMFLVITSATASRIFAVDANTFVKIDSLSAPGVRRSAALPGTADVWVTSTTGTRRVRF